MKNERDSEGEPKRENRRTWHEYVLGILWLFTLLLFVLDVRHSIICRRIDYVALAELLFVLVIVLEGWVAIYELKQTRKQVRFEVLARIHDYIREVQSLGIQKPTIWRDWKYQLRTLSEEDQAAITTYIRLSMNSFLLQWEANNHLLREDDRRHPDEDLLTRDEDFRNFIGKERTIAFWIEHGEFYPEEFREWVNKISKSPGGPTGN
jgi:hypothetical protein